MGNVTEDVLRYLDTGEVLEAWIVNELGSQKIVLHPDFLEELEVQLQIQEIEEDT